MPHMFIVVCTGEGVALVMTFQLPVTASRNKDVDMFKGR
jgi:hypothetical protein